MQLKGKTSLSMYKPQVGALVLTKKHPNKTTKNGKSLVVRYNIACVISTWEIATGESGVQGHPLLHSKIESSVGNLRR